MRTLRLSALAFLTVGFLTAWFPSAAPLQQGASDPSKGGVGDITGPYEVPDPKWPEWAHPYPKPLGGRSLELVSADIA